MKNNTDLVEASADVDLERHFMKTVKSAHKILVSLCNDAIVCFRIVYVIDFVLPVNRKA